MRTLIFALALSVSAAASTIEFDTATDSRVDGQPVSAKAQFDFAPGLIQITITNLSQNPTSIAQNVSGLFFSLEDNSIAGALLQSTFAKELKFDKNGYYSITNDVVPTGWMLRTSGTSLELYVLGVKKVGPAHTLLGLGPYTDANPSITKYNGKHNPFLYYTANFTIAAPLVTAATRVRDVVFSFGSAGTPVNADADIRTVHNPEPASIAMMGGGLAALLLLSSKYARKVGTPGGLGSVAGRGPGSRLAVAPPAGKPGGEAE